MRILAAAAVTALVAIPLTTVTPTEGQAQEVRSMMTGPVTSPATYSGRSTVYAPNGVAATSQPLATTAALEILQNGGNAIDAAVAAAAVLNVTEPHMTGMGGDMFAILWDADAGRLVGLDASGKSGSKTDVDALAAEDDGVPGSGPRSVTVPGALSGWSTLVETYGTMTLAEVLAPAIRIAEEGFPVSPIIAQDWAGTVAGLRRDEGAAATFLIDGEAPEAGDWF
ncbi:MAG: gamma-glutamyltransferase, partial [Gemmatimonadetes bacterium]|nr:gamma-glutamyltransferase [Gemmatimonadota bacterium]